LSAQTVAPPLWLHWEVEVHCAPGASPPVVVVPDEVPPQVPLTQKRFAQH
jgi:hypothetical protein